MIRGGSLKVPELLSDRVFMYSNIPMLCTKRHESWLGKD